MPNRLCSSLPPEPRALFVVSSSNAATHSIYTKLQMPHGPLHPSWILRRHASAAVRSWPPSLGAAQHPHVARIVCDRVPPLQPPVHSSHVVLKRPIPSHTHYGRQCLVVMHHGHTPFVPIVCLSVNVLTLQHGCRRRECYVYTSELSHTQTTRSWQTFIFIRRIYLWASRY